MCLYLGSTGKNAAESLVKIPHYHSSTVLQTAHRYILDHHKKILNHNITEDIVYMQGLSLKNEKCSQMNLKSQNEFLWN